MAPHSGEVKRRGLPGAIPASEWKPAPAGANATGPPVFVFDRADDLIATTGR